MGKWKHNRLADLASLKECGQPQCVDRAQLSTDGGDWATKRAANGVLDETSGEGMGMVAALATPGVHEVRVRGIGRYGNPGDSGGQDSGTVIA